MASSNIKTRGFSLIEIIVSVGVFTVVAMLTVGSLLILTSAEKRVASAQINQDNLRFAMIEMTREIRNGIKYKLCGVAGDLTCFQFKNSNGKPAQYRLDGNAVEYSTDGGSNFNKITGSDIKIDRLEFKLAGADSTDNIQSRVTIVLRGVVKADTPHETAINLQTTISMLKLDI